VATRGSGALASYLEACRRELGSIPAARRADLEAIAGWVTERIRREEVARLVFICTHNSRRSHLAQVWAQTVARSLGVPGVETYSGGTEATALDHRAAAALERAGFGVTKRGDGPNPRWEVAAGPGGPTMSVFSKVFDAPPNPEEDFAAVMTCSSADEACPTVPGASARFSVPWDDPKAADGTPEETATYDARCRQIATEMLWLFSRVGG
jgi:protein-tyrosine phosphatase/arsenate reductase